MVVATTATTSAPTTAARAFPLMYFIIALAFTGLFWTLAALGARGVIPSLPGVTVIGTFGPLVAAVVLIAHESGRVGLRSLLGRILHWRVAPIWYGVVLLGPILLYLAALSLEVILLGGQPPSLGALIGALPILAIVTVYMVIFVAFGEEVGWRGYALPALQARYGALVSSVILGVLWALWHLPLFFNPHTHYSNLPFVLQVAFQIPVAILFTWVFNSTGGSVLMAILLHAVLNASSRLWNVLPEYSVEPPSAAEAAAQTVHINLMMTIVLWVAAVVVVLIYGPRNLSRHPRQVLATASAESRPRVR
ncbi:MAG TPA: type II CAAX endopeptidase family protein [Rubrobacteraceae bacterium]|nr:type II CAAX endopeptidase family protein [Rubrobacteraceae bacterium]